MRQCGRGGRGCSSPMTRCATTSSRCLPLKRSQLRASTEAILDYAPCASCIFAYIVDEQTSEVRSGPASDKPRSVETHNLACRKSRALESVEMKAECSIISPTALIHAPNCPAAAGAQVLLQVEAAAPGAVRLWRRRPPAGSVPAALLHRGSGGRTLQLLISNIFHFVRLLDFSWNRVPDTHICQQPPPGLACLQSNASGLWS